ncbi:MarR family winged helix-turn-helix transcriptional regulator [Desulfofundulus thermocisternus]|uniref:MarR family winged helix-turn-helix transcriptional regulator n=1 Tax=Desulfofundulus thermocisternus TaxID=42471 RepID=UPI00217D10C1|nr:MarR family winged helix-turn-helix transcriptional regulator [Desulfofundulus thermocisternus]MCS5697062.1 MarR family winged helix-turn-helix transcriptional regulator [Desulfofundulus thermocisternus]
MDLEDMAARLCRLLAELGRVTRLVEKSEVGCCGITLSQCHLLLEVSRREGGETSLSDVAAALGLDLSTVSRVADGLVRQNLLCREADGLDRRRLRLVLTDAGRELVEGISCGMREYARTILEEIPAEERAGVLRSLERLAEAVQKVKGGCCGG